MQVYGPVHLHSAQAINAPHTSRVSQSSMTEGRAPIQDELQLSSEAQLLSRIQDVPEMRMDRVAEIRRQIAAGTYETEEKLNVAVGRLFDELG